MAERMANPRSPCNSWNNYDSSFWAGNYLNERLFTKGTAGEESCKLASLNGWISCQFSLMSSAAQVNN
jgi:hypothetical protein